MNKEHFQILCAELAGLAPDDPVQPGSLSQLDNGNYALTLKSGSLIGLFFHEDLGSLVLVTPVGSLPEDPDAALAVSRAFLGANLMWLDNGDYTFALDDDNDRLLLEGRYDEDEGLLEDFISEILIFAETAGHCAEILAQMSADVQRNPATPQVSTADAALDNLNRLI